MHGNARNLCISLRHLRGSWYVSKSPDSWYVHVRTNNSNAFSRGCCRVKHMYSGGKLLQLQFRTESRMELERKSKTKSGPGPYIRSQFTNLLIQFRGSRKRRISPGTGNYPIMSVGLLSNDTPCLVAIG